MVSFQIFEPHGNDYCNDFKKRPKKKVNLSNLKLTLILYTGGERGIRTLGGSFPPHSLSRRAPSAGSAISPIFLISADTFPAVCCGVVHLIGQQKPKAPIHLIKSDLLCTCIPTVAGKVIVGIFLDRSECIPSHVNIQKNRGTILWRRE